MEEGKGKSGKKLSRTKWQVWFTEVLFTNFVMQSPQNPLNKHNFQQTCTQMGWSSMSELLKEVEKHSELILLVLILI